MRQISFFLTTEAFLNGQKDVTRRLGWTPAQCPPWSYLMAVNKCQGLKKGEQIKYGPVLILSNEPERVDEIIKRPIRFEHQPDYQNPRTETEREGFPQWKDSPEKFVEFFCKANMCQPETVINRLVFRRVE